MWAKYLQSAIQPACWELRMPWIESHSVIGRHRKVKGLARQLKIPVPTAVGYLHLLWHSVIEQAEDGDLSQWTPDAIADLAMYEGEPAEFLKALQDNKLFDGLRVHDWLEYAARYLITKYKTRNTPKLREIWAKYGRIYGKEANGEEYGSSHEPNVGSTPGIPRGTTPGSNREPSPNLTDLTDLTKPKEVASLPEGDFLKSAFAAARKAYPGDRNGLGAEWANFKKKYGKDAASIVPLLLPAIEAEKAHKAALRARGPGAFCPDWKHFQTWINNSRWTQELSQVDARTQHLQPSTGGRRKVEVG